MKRLAELETRRRALIARCDAQRAELSWRLAQLSPRRWTGALSGGLGAGGTGPVRPGRHPLAWIVALAALLLLRRPTEALSMLSRARSALSLVTRAAQVLGVLGGLRGLRRARQR